MEACIIKEGAACTMGPLDRNDEVTFTAKGTIVAFTADGIVVAFIAGGIVVTFTTGDIATVHYRNNSDLMDLVVNHISINNYLFCLHHQSILRTLVHRKSKICHGQASSCHPKF